MTLVKLLLNLLQCRVSDCIVFHKAAFSSCSDLFRASFLSREIRNTPGIAQLKMDLGNASSKFRMKKKEGGGEGEITLNMAPIS